MLRFFQVFIVFFWLATTSWLVWTVWAPNGSAFVEMDKNEALDKFFNWNEADSFSIIDNGQRIGQAMISASEGPSRKGNGAIERAFSVSGSLYENAKFLDDPNAVVLSWQTGFVFDDSEPLNLISAQISVGVPQNDLTMTVTLLGDPPLIRIGATVKDIPVFQYSGDVNSLPDLPNELKSGLATSLLGDLSNPAKMFSPEITAKRGTQAFGGRDLPVFLIEIKPSGEYSGIRIYLTQAGEPLKIETDFGFEAISDVLAPLESYGQRGSKQTAR